MTLKSRIRQVLANYHNTLKFPTLTDERGFIKRTTSFFRSRPVWHGRSFLITRSAYIDRSPIVEFHHTTPWPNPDKREVGDILFVSKLKRGNKIVKKKAIIVQSKFTKSHQRSWKNIDTAQFYLTLKWPDLTRVSPKPKKLYKISPSCLTWGTYAFVGPFAVNYALYMTPARIFRACPAVLSQRTFTFNIKKSIGWDTSPSFLMKLIFGFIGEDLLANNAIESFVKDLYKIASLQPDPPGEFEWKPNKEEQKGFGIVEFTLSIPKTV